MKDRPYERTVNSGTSFVRRLVEESQPPKLDLKVIGTTDVAEILRILRAPSHRALSVFVCAILFLTAFPPGPVHGGESGLFPHDPLRITSNSGFTRENGVVSGSGTVEDPYVIEGWDISAAGVTPIFVALTTLPFIIRNVWIHGGFNGILFRLVENGRVENTRITNTNFPIRLSESLRNVIANNELEGNEHGILVAGGFDNIVENNRVTHTFSGGIVISQTADAVVQNNVVSYTGGRPPSVGFGIQIISSYTIVSNNLVSDSEVGISMLSSFLSRIVNNTLLRNDVGMIIAGSNNILIGNNTILSGGRGIDIVFSSRNVIDSNMLQGNEEYGVRLLLSSNNLIYGNLISQSPTAIWLESTIYTVIVGNRLVYDDVGIFLCGRPIGNRYAPPVNDFEGTHRPIWHCNGHQPLAPRLFST